MNSKLYLPSVLLLFIAGTLYSQDEEKPGLKVSGSVDTYYKYDFSGKSQIPTSFANAQNSFGIGMADLSLSQEVGRASFVGELAFGPRANQSAPGPVQNLYITYKFSNLFSVTGGFMATYVGYEVISPVPNFNYSTTYLFTNGPFQNGGLKANFAFSSKVGLMVGVFNHFDWYDNLNPGTGSANPLSLGAQLSLVPVDGMNIYLNLASSKYSGEVYDLTATYQATQKLKLGLNAANRSNGSLLLKESVLDINYTGVAAYINYSLSNPFALGLRYEYFSDIKGTITGFGIKTSINAITLSGNINAGPVRLIPEIRFDAGSHDIFTDASNNVTKSATQVLVAAVYSF